MSRLDTASRTRTDRAVSTPPPVRRKGHAKSDGFWPWLFVVPTILGIGVFYLWPIIQTFYYSFT